jgi:hypothetical protein
MDQVANRVGQLAISSQFTKLRPRLLVCSSARLLVCSSAGKLIVMPVVHPL